MAANRAAMGSMQHSHLVNLVQMIEANLGHENAPSGDDYNQILGFQ